MIMRVSPTSLWPAVALIGLSALCNAFADHSLARLARQIDDPLFLSLRPPEQSAAGAQDPGALPQVSPTNPPPASPLRHHHDPGLENTNVARLAETQPEDVRTQTPAVGGRSDQNHARKQVSAPLSSVLHPSRASHVAHPSAFGSFQDFPTPADVGLESSPHDRVVPLPPGPSLDSLLASRPFAEKGNDQDGIAAHGDPPEAQMEDPSGRSENHKRKELSAMDSSSVPASKHHHQRLMEASSSGKVGQNLKRKELSAGDSSSPLAPKRHRAGNTHPELEAERLPSHSSASCYASQWKNMISQIRTEDHHPFYVPTAAELGEINWHRATKNLVTDPNLQHRPQDQDGLSIGMNPSLVLDTETFTTEDPEYPTYSTFYRSTLEAFMMVCDGYMRPELRIETAEIKGVCAKFYRTPAVNLEYCYTMGCHVVEFGTLYMSKP